MPFATFAAALVMFTSPLLNSSNTLSAVTTVAHSSTASETVLQVSVSNSDEKILTVKDTVHAYYKETPILAKIAFCESSFQHYTKDGQVIRGKVDSRDVGLMQINEKYHLETSLKHGFDIYTIEGNMAYAEWLYERQGTAPWNASAPCWSQSV